MLSQTRGTYIGILWQQQHDFLLLPVFHIGSIDAGIRHDEAAAVRGNDDAGSHANEFGRLAKDELRDTRVLSRAPGYRLCFGAGLDLAQAYEAPFGFRHNLLRENDDIAVGELNAGTRCAREDDLCKIV